MTERVTTTERTSGCHIIPPLEGISSRNSNFRYESRIWKEIRILLFHWIFTLPSEFGSFTYRDTALFRTFNPSIYGFDWFSHEVQTFTDFGLNKGITRVSSNRHFLRIETWNTIWMLLSSEGNRSL